MTIGMRAAMSGAGAALDACQVALRYTPAQRGLFLVIGLTAAFTEESIFRGYLQPALIERRGPVQGMLATAAIFAILHLYFAPSRLLGLFFGIVYGQLRARSGSLIAPAVAHLLCWIVLGSL